jgi:hypothetical protein
MTLDPKSTETNGVEKISRLLSSTLQSEDLLSEAGGRGVKEVLVKNHGPRAVVQVTRRENCDETSVLSVQPQQPVDHNFFSVTTQVRPEATMHAKYLPPEICLDHVCFSSRDHMRLFMRRIGVAQYLSSNMRVLFIHIFQLKFFWFKRKY